MTVAGVVAAFAILLAAGGLVATVGVLTKPTAVGKPRSARASVAASPPPTRRNP